MKSLEIESLFVWVYVQVDDWYKEEESRLLKGKVGSKAKFSDAEIITLQLMSEYIALPTERNYYSFIKANYMKLFPNLVEQSEFNRRSRSLSGIIEEFRLSLMKRLVTKQPDYLLVDTKPIPVVGYKRDKTHSEFLGSADYGYCSSKKMKYFGYKLVSVTTLSGFMLYYELVPASTDERIAVESVLARLKACHGDKGFIGEWWQQDMFKEMGHTILTPKRKNQYIQLPRNLELKLNSVRERVEGFFNEIQNVGRNIERLFAKTIRGLTSRIIVKMTSYTLKHFFRQFFGIDVISFQIDENFTP